MRSVVCVGLAVLVLLPCADAGAKASGKKKNKNEKPAGGRRKSPQEILRGVSPDTKLADLTEEQAEAYESTKGNQKCNACEALVERVQKAMVEVGQGQGIRASRPGEGDPQKVQKKLERAQRTARAIEILDNICTGQDQVLYCQEALGLLEDKLTEYIVAGEFKEDAKIDICDDMCEWKVGIKNSIKDMQANFLEEAKREELKRRMAKEKEILEEQLRHKPSLVERVFKVLRVYWYIFAGIFGVFFAFVMFMLLWLRPRLLLMQKRRMGMRQRDMMDGASSMTTAGPTVRKRHVAGNAE
eukprot:TRINITY_DN7785_c3_g1_i2.p1 TRINITY_DN7785_c3_g1~~TRINITY_DN7785_c3_g1_i2.p1  ORF type:complete len:299 (+),score=61.20 TRINITY_DN7785_c3_g1_i2:78-974(+)